jgi:PAS domain S-box-containing protein
MDKAVLRDLILGHESWLMHRVLAYAKQRHYTKYTSTLVEAWRTSIAGLSEPLVEALHVYHEPPEIGPEEDFTIDPIASFGILEAQRHRSRGVTLAMFLGLMKYYRQSYVDLILQAGFDKDDEEWARLFVNRFFDRVELGFTVEWSAPSTESVVEEMQVANLILVTEKNKYLTLFESLANPVVLLNEDNLIDNMNHAAALLFEASQTSGGYYYGNGSRVTSLDWLERELKTFLEGSEKESVFEKALDTHDGERYFEVRLKKMLDVSQKFSGTVITLNDISSRVFAGRELSRSLHHVNQIINSLPDPTWVVDDQGRVTAWNLAMEEMSGVKAEEMIGKGNSEHSLPFYGERRPALIDLALFGDESCLSRYISLKRLDDGVFRSESYHPGMKGGIFLSGTARVLYDMEGRPSGAIESLRDITEAKKSEKILRDSERRLAQIIEFLPDATMVIDANGRLIAWNRAISDLTGVDASDVVGKGDYEYAIPFYGHRRPVMIDLVINRGEDVASQYLYVRHEGDRLVSETYFPDFHGRGRTWLWNTAAPLYDDEGRVVGAIEAIRDITKLKLEEEKRLELERRLLQSQKLESLGMMAAGIAHNFNNLLQAVLGNVELALMQLPDASPARLGLKRAYEAGDRAARVSGQMLAYTGNTMFVPEDHNLNAIIEANLAFMKSLVPSSASVDVFLSEFLPPISGDHAQIKQVIMNLAANAMESLGDEQGTICIKTGFVNCEKEYLRGSLLDEKPNPGLFVFLDVTDTGCGMDSETMERLFEPFFTTKFTGRGLGLAAVYGIVTAHRGAIMVDSAIGVGTTVRVLFPVTDRAREELTQGDDGRNNEPDQSAIPSKGVILVVDDEEWVRDLSLKRLEYLGYSALTACDGQEAVEIFRDHVQEITCVLLDLSMPKKGGGEVFEELRRIKPDVKVLLASGYGEEEALRRFGKVLPAGFIHKPHDLQALADALDEILDQANPNGSPLIITSG